MYFAGTTGFVKCSAMRDHIESRDLNGMFLADYSERTSFLWLWHSREIQVVHYHLQSACMLQCCLKPMIDYAFKMQISFFTVQNFLKSSMEDTVSKKESETKALLKDWIFRFIPLQWTIDFLYHLFTSTLSFQENMRQWVTASSFILMEYIRSALLHCLHSLVLFSS